MRTPSADIAACTAGRQHSREATGYSYSVELSVDQVNDAGTQWAAFLLFLRWRRIGESGVEGHLETIISRVPPQQMLRAMRSAHGRCSAFASCWSQRIEESAPPPTRRWFDVMHDDAEPAND